MVLADKVPQPPVTAAQVKEPKSMKNRCIWHLYIWKYGKIKDREMFKYWCLILKSDISHLITTIHLKEHNYFKNKVSKSIRI